MLTPYFQLRLDAYGVSHSRNQHLGAVKSRRRMTDWRNDDSTTLDFLLSAKRKEEPYRYMTGIKLQRVIEFLVSL